MIIYMRSTQMKSKFDDENGVIFIVKYQGGATTIVLYTTSWYRKLLFSLGINWFYKKTLLVVKGNPFNL